MTTTGHRFPAGEERAYSTPGLLELETRVIDRAIETHQSTRGRVNEHQAEQALAADDFLTASSSSSFVGSPGTATASPHLARALIESSEKGRQWPTSTPTSSSPPT